MLSITKSGSDGLAGAQGVRAHDQGHQHGSGHRHWRGGRGPDPDRARRGTPSRGRDLRTTVRCGGNSATWPRASHGLLRVSLKTTFRVAARRCNVATADADNAAPVTSRLCTKLPCGRGSAVPLRHRLTTGESAGSARRAAPTRPCRLDPDVVDDLVAALAGADQGDRDTERVGDPVDVGPRPGGKASSSVTVGDVLVPAGDLLVDRSARVEDRSGCRAARRDARPRGSRMRRRA